MTLLFYYKPRLLNPDLSDVLRKKRQQEREEEQVAAQLLKAYLENEDVVLPSTRKKEVGAALGKRFREIAGDTSKDREREGIKFLLITLLLDDD